MDLILLENQPPTKLLQLLSKENGEEIHILFTNYFCIGAIVKHGMKYKHANHLNPVHLLDFIHSVNLSPLKIIVRVTSTYKENLLNLDNGIVDINANFGRLTFKNIRDLSTDGI